jgi:hypothetical protein
MLTTAENKKIQAALQFCRENGCLPSGRRTCVVCNEPPSVGDDPFLVGLYFADKKESKRLGVPKGKSRVVIYLLCHTCFELSDSYDQVADSILRQIGVQ